MTKQVKVILCIALSFMFLFMTIGFSAITDSLKIIGSVETNIPEGLFITNISQVATG